MNASQSTKATGLAARAEPINGELHFATGTGIDGKEHLFIYQVPNTGWPLADCGWSQGPMREQTFANARLFASSRVMLNCLERVDAGLSIRFQSLVDSGVDSEAYWQCMLTNVQQAIAAHKTMTLTPAAENLNAAPAASFVDEWMGPFSQPFKAIAACAEKHGLSDKVQRFFWKSLPNWEDVDEADFLADLLQEIAGETNIVLIHDSDGWRSRLDA